MFGKIRSTKCDSEVFKNGHTVFCVGDLGTDEIETWVEQVALRSGQQVDWHYSGGRAIILGLGDLDKIRNTIKAMLPELNKSLNEYAKNKWGIISNKTTFTEEDVDSLNNKEVCRNFSQS